MVINEFRCPECRKWKPLDLLGPIACNECGKDWSDTTLRFRDTFE